MPRGDRTGPQGMGPRTGRGMGYCSGFDTPGYMNPGPGNVGLGLARGRGRAMPGYGMGMAWGRGGGRGMGYRAFPYYPEAFAPAPMGPGDERSALEGTIKAMKSQIEAMEKRLSELPEKE